MRVIAIILAAGQGRRMNLPVAKQFLSLHGKPMIYYSLRAFEESKADEIILVTGEEQLEYCKKLVDEYKLSKVSKLIAGGAERYDSVYNALLSIDKADYVLIHDGARPFISREKINAVIDGVIEYKACIIGTAVKETVKLADDNGFVDRTPPRNIMWAAQTPQAFEHTIIRKAYDSFYKDESRNTAITDDSMICEIYAKAKVKILMGDYNNIKVTTLDDLALAEHLATLYFN